MLDAAVLAHAQEDDAVDGDLDGVVQLALAELRIAQGEVLGQHLAPAFDLFQESRVDGRGAFLALGGFGVFVERAFENRVLGEDAGDVVPLRRHIRRR